MITRGMIAGIQRPTHHNLYLQEYIEDIEQTNEQTADFARAVGWAFLTAWTHRFGGFHQHLVQDYTLVDPARWEADNR